MNKEVQTTDNELHDLIKASPEETRPYGGWEGCWPGNGSGMDDFEDYNQNEGRDY
jgi:hypothetical protein